MGKTVVLGVSGSIAAYKAADLASQLVKDGIEVYPVLTPGASRFIGPATFNALTSHPCPIDVFDEPFPGEIAHIHLAKIADLFAIIPASMDLMARLANGLAGDMLAAATLATTAPVLLAPAMNSNMWSNSATRENERKLTAYGYRFVDPVSGRLACRTEGVGKMADVASIATAIHEILNEGRAWAGKKVLVTAGPTRERIDPVRYITNRSSGKMGYAVAEAAARQGAQVTLVSGPVSIPCPFGVNLISVETAEQMQQAVPDLFSEADAIFAAAAVSDYRPADPSVEKIKKSDLNMHLALRRNPDILAGMGRAKRPGQFLVGFAAETQEVAAGARAKLSAKNLDMIVANDVTKAGAGFDVDTNIVTIHTRSGETIDLPRMTKREVALKLLSLALERLNAERGEV